MADAIVRKAGLRSVFSHGAVHAILKGMGNMGFRGWAIFLALGSLAAGEPKGGERPPLRLALVGDVMPGSAYPSGTELPKADGARLFERVAPEWRDADLLFGNLEGVLCDACLPRDGAGRPNNYRFLIPARFAKALRDAGFSVMSGANNHANDGGAGGVASTRAAMAEVGVPVVGTPEAPDAVLTTKTGLKVGWIAFAPHAGTLGFDPADMAAKVRDLRKRADIVVVSMHTGAEGAKARHLTKQTEHYLGADRGNPFHFAHAAIDAGADVVVGHGPHVLRAMEVYRERIIAYSLGNFATYGRFKLDGPSSLGAILKIDLAADGRFLGGAIVSTTQEKGSEGWEEGIGPVPDPAGRAAAEIRTLTDQDFPRSGLTIGPDGSIRR